MSKFPEPPLAEWLAQLSPVTVTYPAGTRVARIYFAEGNHPVVWDSFRYFGPTASRFDHHQLDTNNHPHNQERGIIYLAAGNQMIPTCLAECFQASRIIDRHHKAPTLVGFELAEEIQLLDLTGPFTTKMGASMEINSGPRPRARRWAQALYQAFPQIQGILYCSSMYANHPAVALFERAGKAFPPRPIIHKQLSDPSLYSMILATADLIGYQVI